MTFIEKVARIKAFCDCAECSGEGCPLYNTSYSNDGVCLENHYFSDDVEAMYKILFGDVEANFVKVDNDLAKVEEDLVNHPSHYTSGGIECIDAIAASMTPDEYAGFLKGQVIKYVWRYRLKGKPLEDLKKARFYLERLISSLEQEATV